MRSLKVLPPDTVPTPRNLPATRADCQYGPRPCPYVSCRHNLYLDVSTKTGAIKFNFPILESTGVGPAGMADSCVLDVAERGPMTNDEIGDRIGSLTRERCRQIELIVMGKLRKQRVLRELAGQAWEDPDDGKT